MPTIGRVYFTSRKTRLGYQNWEIESGWVFRYRGKESKIYKDRKEAELDMLVRILVKKS